MYVPIIRRIMESIYFQANIKKQVFKRPRKSTSWIPPKSPYHLIQEILYHDPWKLLLCTIFLHKTNGKSAIPIFWQFLDKWGTPDKILLAKKEEMEEVLQPLGLHKKRTNVIKKFTEEYLTKSWKYPIELHGIGKYGNDSYKIFCINEWQNVRPNDSKLILYHKWLLRHQYEVMSII